MRDLGIDALEKQKQRLYEELSAASASSRKYHRILKAYFLVYDRLKLYSKA